MTDDIEITIAFPAAARVGEGPFWDSGTGRLHWVDILAGKIHTSDPTTPGPATLALSTLVGAAVPKSSGGFVAATSEGFTDVAPDGGWITRLNLLGPGDRMNDAKCDANGRMWSGSCALDFTPGRGALYLLSGAPEWQAERVLDGLTLPNGMDWSPDRRTFYLIDTQARELNAFDVLPGAPHLAHRRVLSRFAGIAGVPDGMTVDAQGCLWVAMWGGGRLVRLSPEGDVLTQIPVPVAQPSSCAFGGPGLDVLYVTTAREGLSPGPGAADGSVLAVRGLGVTGLPAHRFGG